MIRTIERDGSVTLEHRGPTRLPAGYREREVVMCLRAPAYARDLFSLATVRAAERRAPLAAVIDRVRSQPCVRATDRVTATVTPDGEWLAVRIERAATVATLGCEVSFFERCREDFAWLVRRAVETAVPLTN